MRTCDTMKHHDVVCCVFQGGGKCRKSNDLVMLMIDRWLRRHPVRRRVPGGRGSRSSAGFRRRGERAAILTVPDASRRLRAGLPQDLWRGCTKHVADASLFRCPTLNGPTGRRDCGASWMASLLPSSGCA